jgi:hypothetical protein
MLKRLSMVLAATAVIGVCMAMVPQRVEGAYITHLIKTPSNDIGYNGTTGIGDVEKDFIAGSENWKNLAVVRMGWIGSGKKTTWAKIFNRKSSYGVKIKWYWWSKTFPHRKGPNHPPL